MANKKYYQSPKMRKKESEGMKRYLDKKDKKYMHKNDYKGHMYREMENEFFVAGDPKRRAELEDSYMIREDRRAISNLPPYVIMKEYPKPRYGYGIGINDTIKGIDIQMADDSDEMKTHYYPEKY